MNRDYLQNLKAETEKKALEKAIADAADELISRILDFASTSKARKLEINVFTLMSNLKTHFSKRVLPILKSGLATSKLFWEQWNMYLLKKPSLSATRNIEATVTIIIWKLIGLNLSRRVCIICFLHQDWVNNF